MNSTIDSPERECTDEGQHDKLRHSYPAAVKEGRLPVPGDVARCGYVKRGPTTVPGTWGTSEACVVCEHLVYAGRQ
jgi:hypothetical protein